MSVHSASGRRSLRIPKGPAKVIPLPIGQRRPRYRRTFAVAAASLGATVVGAALIWFYFMPLIGMAPDLNAGMSAQEGEILRLVNDERRRSGASPLKSASRLVLASRGHSYDMALRSYLGHDGPAGDTPTERARGVGVEATELGENLYLDRNADRTRLAERVLRGWLDDPAERATMLSPRFSTTGIGIARAADGAAYVTQDFAN